MAGEKPTRFGDLEIRQDLAYHRKLWRFQRIGWIAMALVVVAALLGVFGAKGMLNQAVATDEVMQVEYERFPHVDTRTALRINVARTRPPDNRFELRLSNAYLRSIQIEEITPRPVFVRSAEGELVLVFETLEPKDGLLVTMPFIPKELGPLKARVRAGPQAAAIVFTQFVYP